MTTVNCDSSSTDRGVRPGIPVQKFLGHRNIVRSAAVHCKWVLCSMYALQYRLSYVFLTLLHLYFLHCLGGNGSGTVIGMITALGTRDKYHIHRTVHVWYRGLEV